MGICYLVGAGDFFGKINVGENDIVIAADGGYDNLVRHGYTPDILVGDFDSIVGDAPEGICKIKYPVKKDETDMFLAYKTGVEVGYTDFVMLGATGGRLDHTYANLSLLLYAKEHGHNVTAINDGGVIFCIKNETVSLEGDEGATFSVFAIGGKAQGVTIKDAEYETSDTELDPSFPLGISNKFKAVPASISVKDGALLVIAE